MMRNIKKRLLVWSTALGVFANALVAAQFERPAGTTLRVGSYNVRQSIIYKGNDNASKQSRYDSWIRVVNGVKADIWVLQEMYYSDNGVDPAFLADFTSHMRNITGDSSWNYASDLKGRVLVSRYPVKWSKEITHRVHATWIDLPSSVSSKDLIVINVHLAPGDKNQTRVDQATAGVDFLTQVRTGNYSAAGTKIPADISVIFCGDFNAGPTSDPANVVKNAGLTKLNPVHLGASSEVNTHGEVVFSNGSLTDVTGGVLDLFFHQSSTLQINNYFIFNTFPMSSSLLTSTGLHKADVAIEPEQSYNYNSVSISCDHFAIITDFKDPSVSQTTVPVVSLAVPSANVTVNAGTNLYVKVNSTDPDGISQVRLYKNGVKLARNESGSPYEWGLASQNDPELKNLPAGSFVLTAEATDTKGTVGKTTASITVTVKSANLPPYFTSNPFSKPDATVGTAYNEPFSGKAVDPEGGTMTFSKVSGPVWLSVTTAGNATGTPGSVDVGTNSFMVKVTDNGGLSATATMTIKVNAPTNPPQTVTFTSIAAEDGYVNESSETTNIGGTLSSTSSAGAGLRVGDMNDKKQVKTILSFDTSSLPDGAVIQSATLKLMRGGGSGSVTNLGQIKVDIKGGSGFNNATALSKEDFQAAADATGVAVMSYPTANGTLSTGALNATGLTKVNKTGKTQLKVYFATDDDNDGTSDYLGFYPAENGTAANRPVLVITYQ